MVLSVVPASLPASGSIEGTFDQIDRFGLLIYVVNSVFITGVQLVGGAIAIWRL